MKQLFILLACCMAAPAFAQIWPVKKLIIDKQTAGAVFKSIPAFTFVANKTIAGRGIYQQLRLNASFRSQLMEQRPEAIQLTLPLDGRKSITCMLVKFSLGNVKFTENNQGTIDNLRIPVSYRGIVEGEQDKNDVTLCVNDDYISLVASFADNTLQVTKADESDKSLYRLYNSAKIAFPVTTLDCGTTSFSKTKTTNGIDLTGARQAEPAAVQDKCVNVFVDCFDSLFIWRSSNRQQTINYVYELFSSITTCYLNESVNIQITTINVWTAADPYRGDNRSNALYDLETQWQDNFWGNICVGLDYSPSQRIRSGLASDIGRVKGVAANTCPAYSHEGTDSVSACCYAELNYVGFSTQYFPTGPNSTGAQVYLVTHEIGHLLGAHHTQWCGWKLTSNPDTFGALDSCAATERINNSTPPCPKGPPPGNGGTIMSYCTAGVGGNFINYYNGFGTLPGTAVRNFVSENLCIINCVDCFGTTQDGRKNDVALTAHDKTSGHGEKNKKSDPSASPNSQTTALIPSQNTKR